MEEIFEGERVHKLSDGIVRQLMEEDSHTAAKRRELRDQEHVLQSGLDICRDIAGRNDLGPYERQEPALYSGYDVSSRLNRPDPFAERPDTPPPSLPGRKPVTGWEHDDHHEDARNSGTFSPAAETPTTADDEDAQLQRAIEESKRDAQRRSYQPAMPPRPAQDDDSSSIRPNRRRLFGRG